MFLGIWDLSLLRKRETVSLYVVDGGPALKQV